jgi:hypothetical protein
VLRLRTLPQVMRWVVVGAASLGSAGAIVGLVVGLHVYAPTAPFAIVELGLPATLVGGLVGLVTGSMVALGRRIKRAVVHTNAP